MLEGGKGKGEGVKEQKIQWGRDAPTLSQPHAWLLLQLIMIAVQTRPTAATNISGLM